ncbi:MAG: hypothetical protein AAFU49_14580 [Pseudomonadota bacterium]
MKRDTGTTARFFEVFSFVGRAERWMVERACAGISVEHRLAAIVRALTQIAMIEHLSRRIARGRPF